MENNITIKNISSAQIVISLPDLKFRRELVPGRTISVTRETYDEMMFDSGINGLINDHYLLIEGLEENEVSGEVAKNIYDYDKIAKIYDALDVTAFAKMIPNAVGAEKDTIVQLAIEKGITHPAFVKLINQYCGVDIINAINMRHQLEQ